MHTSGGAAERGSGLRGRWLAPVYALAVSFLAVLLLGAVMPEPEQPTTVHLRFVTNGQPAAALHDAEVEVLAGADSDLTVNAEGGVDAVTSGRPLRICVHLPAGWKAQGETKPLGDLTCWERVTPDAEGRVQLAVTRSGAAG
ncbi:hypothetical protein LZG04_20500 [Saccharothrix sp. S26]|uniref:hypothetical protein n=1 Tax=Saccharothrix sp. S26 TaxID=2907215 RepID=UPI001F163C81|nr:hypothetical protein [Saccharothrix sp. S26]MCE6997164.1 hypothetical protein [Saccharothrix sp. S26]